MVTGDGGGGRASQLHLYFDLLPNKETFPVDQSKTAEKREANGQECLAAMKMLKSPRAFLKKCFY